MTSLLQLTEEGLEDNVVWLVAVINQMEKM